MSDFEQQLREAIRRGESRGRLEQHEDSKRAEQIAELKNLHSKLRLAMTEHIERVVRRLADHFPGFKVESVFGEAGWGTACSRDDLFIEGKTRTSRYSRFEIAVRPVNEFFVIDLQSRGTIANRELFHRSHFQQVQDAQLQQLQDLVDRWALQYAELYAAQQSRQKR